MHLEGEKCSKYFCHLEKRQYTEKIIPKLISHDNKVLTDINSILKEQVHFYSNLYQTSNPVMNDTNRALFFDDNNPFLNKLSDAQMQTCEGKLSLNECSKALANMKNGKSPGLDGFTVEFYKFFWPKLKNFFYMCYEFCFSKQ